MCDVRRRVGVVPDASDPTAPPELATAFKALANPMRVQILDWLKEPTSFPPQLEPAADVGVCLKHIQARAGVSQSTASQYLASLQDAGLVTSRRIGPWTYFARDEARIGALTELIRATL